MADAVGVDTDELVACVRSACHALSVRDASLGLMIVGAERMASVNAEHRGRASATDVLSFPLDGLELADWPDGAPPPELGDIVICPDAADEPLATLVVHGLLHLLGYDHETDDGEMLALQDRLLSAQEPRE
ncbi:MAG: rRNA maturation RNase YbeY [Miltoncostaeaceae bacterium]